MHYITPPSCFIYPVRDVTPAVIKHHGEFQGASWPVAWWRGDRSHWRAVHWARNLGKLQPYALEPDGSMRCLAEDDEVHFAYPAPKK